jgi:hypothetical protein
VVDAETGEVTTTTTKVAITPMEAMAKVLGEDAYLPVRAVLEGLRDKIIPKLGSVKRKFLDYKKFDGCDDDDDASDYMANRYVSNSSMPGIDAAKRRAT